jgi:hypothetical protein
MFQDLEHDGSNNVAAAVMSACKEFLNLRRVARQDNVELATVDTNHLAFGFHQSAVSVKALLNRVGVGICCQMC